MNTHRHHEEAMTLTKSQALGAAVAAALGLTLLTGCGGTDAATVPEGWGTLDTESVSVGYPEDRGYAPQPAAERSKANAAVALKEEGGLRTGMVSVQLDFATGVSDAGEAAAAAGAGIGLGTTRTDTADVRVAGEEGARDVRRIDYEFTSTGEKGTPRKGTRMTGVLVAGVDSEGAPFAIRINAVKGTLTDADLNTFTTSITAN